ncbi:MAG: radical SAM protein [Firmicutes bacterium]|nr:radical SAM protein [Bacillota bacterium]
METKSVTLSWNITGQCPERCGYCFGGLGKDTLTKEDHFKIADKIIADQVDEVAIAGGEPMMLEHLPELIKYLHDGGIKNIRLNTGSGLRHTGIFHRFGLYQKILPYLSQVSIPFEGGTRESERKIRGSQENGANIFDEIQTVTNAGVGCVINTCVHKQNIWNQIHSMNNLVKMGEYLTHLENNFGLKIDKWSLRQFFPVQGAGAKNIEQFDISTDEYRQAVKEVIEAFPNLNIEPREIEDFQRMYLMLDKEANLFRARDGNNITLGNVLHENISIRQIAETEQIQERI